MQSARMKAARKIYERALRDKDNRNEIVRPHQLDAGQWILVRYENPQKFEPKLYESYQIRERMPLDIYKLQDSNERLLTALVHDNRLINAGINDTIEKLEQLRASPKMKDILRRRNVEIDELISTYTRNTDALN